MTTFEEDDPTASWQTGPFAGHKAVIPEGYGARLGEAGICDSCGKPVRLQYVGDDVCLWIAHGEPADTEARCDGGTSTFMTAMRLTRHHARKRLWSYHYSDVVQP
ncbi:hypothetical protein GCM10027059_36920 [Myceligenerans halotolerans]